MSFVHPRAIPQMADADEVWRGITRNPDVRYSALVPNLRGTERAVEAGFAEIEVVVSASDTHNRANLNRTTDESLAEIAGIADLVHSAGGTLELIVSTAWGCPYEGDVPIERVLDVAARGLAAGADSLTYGDTTGMATPTRVIELVTATRARFADCRSRCIFTTRGGRAWPTFMPPCNSASLASMRASVVSAGALTRRERPATSPPKRSSPWSRTWASAPASTCRRCSRRLSWRSD